MTSVVLGFDPGGKSGVAMGEVVGQKIAVTCDTVDSVIGAFDWFSGRLKRRIPSAIGIDAFLFWSTAKSGWRHVDKALREKYPKAQASIICSNSAHGSMAVQGMAFAVEANERWRGVRLNEVHPKLLWHAVANGLPYPRTWLSPDNSSACRWFANRDLVFARPPHNEHEFDAALAVWVTWKGITENLF